MFFLPIPTLFFSAYSGVAFELCIDCEAPLAPSGVIYSVQKFIVAGEAVFELAMCNECREGLYVRFSDESRAAIQGYIEERTTAKAQPLAPAEHAAPAPLAIDPASLDSLQACVLCHTPKSQLRRYGLMGLFAGYEMLVLDRTESRIPVPCLICDRCNSGLEKLLSKSTKEEWNRFVEDHFPGPPGIELDPTREVPLLV